MRKKMKKMKKPTKRVKRPDADLDRTAFTLDAAMFDAFMAVLDERPPPNDNEPEALAAIGAVFGVTPKRMRAGKTLSESELADYYPLSGGVWSAW